MSTDVECPKPKSNQPCRIIAPYIYLLAASAVRRSPAAGDAESAGALGPGRARRLDSGRAPEAVLPAGGVGGPDGVGGAGALQDVVAGLALGALSAGRRAQAGRARVEAGPLGADLVAAALLVARAAGLAGPVDNDGVCNVSLWLERRSQFINSSQKK